MSLPRSRQADRAWSLSEVDREIENSIRCYAEQLAGMPRNGDRRETTSSSSWVAGSLGDDCEIVGRRSKEAGKQGGGQEGRVYEVTGPSNRNLDRYITSQTHPINKPAARIRISSFPR